ncbi:MAG: DUF5837 family cyanobactin class RiPP [Cyanobacteria bacterium P01_F01_bin.150]
MNKKTITPNPKKPVARIPTGQLPSELLELSEDTLSGAGVRPANQGACSNQQQCSFDGDDE